MARTSHRQLPLPWGRPAFHPTSVQNIEGKKGLNSNQQDKYKNKEVAFKGTLNIKLVRFTRPKSNKQGEKGNLFQTIQRANEAEG